MTVPRRISSSHAITAVVFIVIGLAVVWFLKAVIGITGDAILVAALLGPFALYLVLSDKVSELTAGSFALKLREVSREPVIHLTETADQINPEQGPFIGAGDLILLKTNPNVPHVLTLVQGRGSYTRETVLDKLQQQAAFSPVPVVVVLDDYGEVLAYTNYRSALDLLKNEAHGDEFIALVNGTDRHAFDHGFSALTTVTLRTTDTNAKALRTMDRTGLDTLVVVDDDTRRFAGIVERTKVVSRLILALVDPDAATA